MDRLLAKNIIATLTYYDVLDFPLTSFEIWRHMIWAQDGDHNHVWTPSEVEATLAQSDVRKYIAEKNGFYFLHGRESLVKIRGQRERVSVAKIKKLKRYVFWLRCVPFVRMITLTGRLSYKNGEPSSDLDILVAFAHGHIWTGRLLFTIATHVMGVRRYGDKHADRVCLNYYVSDQHLEVPTKDLYAAHEYSFIVPMYGQAVFAEFVKANRWIRQYKPHYISENVESQWTQGDNAFCRLKRNAGEFLFRATFIEDKARAFQKKKILTNPKTQLPGACIIAEDTHLVFLPKPHGPRVFDEYKKRYGALEIPWQV